MYGTQSMVIANSIEKIADYELPKDHSQWQQEILKQFFEKFQSLPPNLSVDVVISNQDENRGYAKGSIVVGGAGKQINFPVIVKDSMLSPFDVFVSSNTTGEQRYYPATESHIAEQLISSDLGQPSTGPYSSYDEAISLKRPGGIPAKVPVISEDISKFSSAPKCWKDCVLESDKQNLLKKLADSPELPTYFEANSGTALQEIIDLPTEKGLVPSQHIAGKVDYSDVVKARQAITVVDTMLFDPNKLIPIESGNVAELRTKRFPSMEEFLETGDNAALRKLTTDMGQPVVGLVMDVDACDRWDSNRQVFVSMKGGYYCMGERRPSSPDVRPASDPVDDGHVFYGSDLSDSPAVADSVVDIWKQIRQPWAMTRPKYDKGFVDPHNGGEVPWGRADDGWKPDLYAGVLIIYKDGGKYRAYKPDAALLRRVLINGAEAFIDDQNSSAIIKTAVAKPTVVEKVNSPEYMAIVGTRKKILLVPNDCVMLNLAFMRRMSSNDFLKPGDDVRRALVNAGLKSLKVKANEKTASISIEGAAIEPAYQIFGIDKSAGLEPAEAIALLNVCGVDRNTAVYAMTKAATGEPSTIYGVRDDYICDKSFRHHEKIAEVKDLLGQAADMLKRDMIKAASLIKDPEAVDAMLSLNFINRENLMSYVEDIPKFDAVIQRLCSLLVASRMGLQQIDEAAVKTAVEGLDGVVKGLVEIKTSLGV